MSDSPWTPQQAVPDDLVSYLENLKVDPPSHKNGFFYAFLRILFQLKATKRTGWIDFDVPGPESIADHMYRMSIIAMCNSDENLDISRCVKMALIHDMAEALVGDITPADVSVSKQEKHRRELATMEYLRDLLTPVNARAAQEIFEIWNEYEDMSTPEAVFVKDVDKFELMVQTLEYERLNKDKDLSRFLTVRSQIKTSQVSDWADGILEERKLLWENKS
jgi:putative hydrolase of HD superfamily